jgi:hypothetical protein
MNDERVRRHEFAAILHPVLDEGEFAELFAAPVQPDIRAAQADIARLPVVRDDHAVRLHRAVDAREVATHYEPGFADPQGRAPTKFLESLAADLELQPRRRDLLRIENLVVAQRPIHGLVEDLHVGQEREQVRLVLVFELELKDVAPEFSDAFGEFVAIRLRNLDARRRHAAHGFSIGGEAGCGEDDEGENWGEGIHGMTNDEAIAKSSKLKFQSSRKTRGPNRLELLLSFELPPAALISARVRAASSPRCPQTTTPRRSAGARLPSAHRGP